MRILDIYMAFYQKYLDQCYFNGDIWSEYFTPYTYQEWILAGMPDGPGKNDEYCNKK